MSSFGEELRRERELRHISLREISDATKISMRYLDALERNDFRHLPGGVFNKGFVRAYAKFIGVDPETMVNAYLMEQREQEAQGRQQKSDGPRRASETGRAGLRSEPGPDARVRRNVWVAASLLALLLAVSLLVGFIVVRYRRTGGVGWGGVIARTSPAIAAALSGEASGGRGSVGSLAGVVADEPTR